MPKKDDDDRPMTFHLRLDPELRRRLDEYAIRTDRSVNRAATHLIRRGLEAEQEGLR